jgi:putative nucleotidyltransferase with HDIG domain
VYAFAGAMDFDSYDTPQAEQMLEVGAGRWRVRAPRLLTTEFVAAALVLAAAILFVVLDPPHRHVGLLAVVSVVGVYVICDRVLFPVGPAWTSATQLAFVPMLLLLPTGVVPGVIIGCRLVPLLVPVLRHGEGRPPLASVLGRIADSAYALGPVLVLVLAHERGFNWSSWPVYAAAMAAQILVDFGSGVARSWFSEGINPAEMVPVVVWVYLVDMCLTSVGLFVDASAEHHHGLVLLILPLVGLLALFARERKQRMVSSQTLSETYRETAELLGEVLEDDDASTGVHSREVAALAMDIAERLELDPLSLFNVRYGALLHDVGKISVPKTILQKQGKLTPEEWKIMREHTVRGQEMLDRVGGSLRAVGRIVRHSHEHYDGSGYPDRLAGTNIPIESRIVAAADAWNAMTTSRPYRRALSVEVAADEMKRCSGSHFDPTVVVALLQEVAPAYVEGLFVPAGKIGRGRPDSMSLGL